MKIDTEWYYDRRLDKETVDRIEAALTEDTIEWVTAKESELRAHLAKHPKQMSTGTLEASAFYLDDSEKLFCLRGVMIHRNDDDPYQCVIYAGHEDFISRNQKAIVADFRNQCERPGVNGFVVEQDLK
jgi:hypothetical protein